MGGCEDIDINNFVNRIFDTTIEILNNCPNVVELKEFILVMTELDILPLDNKIFRQK